MPDADEFPHLNHAPITEALLDIRVELPPGAAVEALAARFGDTIRRDFPEERPIQRLATKIQMGAPDGPGPASSTEQTLFGKIFWSTDHKRGVQARLDGFSVNHVGAYKDWGSIKGDAERYWPAYIDAAHPVRVTRCAARFVNRIEVPVGTDMAPFLQTRPEIGSKLPQMMSDFSMRIVLPFSSTCHAVIVQAALPVTLESVRSRTRAMLLDIDVFSDGVFEPSAPEMWARLDELRAAKNKCFFWSLHETIWKVYEK